MNSTGWPSSELVLLTSRFNAHLTFNVMNTLKGIVAFGERDEAGELIDRYARLLRRMVVNGSIGTTLSQELETIEDYLEVERIRMDYSFKYTIDVSERLHQSQLPKSVLVSMVENAVKHGMRYSNLNGFMGEGFIRIQSDKRGSLKVVNNAPADYPASDPGCGIGLTRALIVEYNRQTGSTWELVTDKKPAKNGEILVTAALSGGL